MIGTFDRGLVPYLSFRMVMLHGYMQKKRATYQ
jgi:hypothetical protein